MPFQIYVQIYNQKSCRIFLLKSLDYPLICKCSQCQDSTFQVIPGIVQAPTHPEITLQHESDRYAFEQLSLAAAILELLDEPSIFCGVFKYWQRLCSTLTRTRIMMAGETNYYSYGRPGLRLGLSLGAHVPSPGPAFWILQVLDKVRDTCLDRTLRLELAAQTLISSVPRVSLGSSNMYQRPTFKTDPVRQIPPKGSVINARSVKYLAAQSRKWSTTVVAKRSFRSLALCVRISGVSLRVGRTEQRGDFSIKRGLVSSQAAQNSAKWGRLQPPRTKETSSLPQLQPFSIKNLWNSLSTLLQYCILTMPASDGKALYCESSSGRAIRHTPSPVPIPYTSLTLSFQLSSGSYTLTQSYAVIIHMQLYKGYYPIPIGNEVINKLNALDPQFTLILPLLWGTPLRYIHQYRHCIAHHRAGNGQDRLLYVVVLALDRGLEVGEEALKGGEQREGVFSKGNFAEKGFSVTFRIDSQTHLGAAQVSYQNVALK